MENSNISEIIIGSITTILNTLFSSIDNNLYKILDDITFLNTDILNNYHFINLFGTPSEGFLLIANSLLVGFLLYYSIKLIFSNLVGSQIESPFQFLFKIIIFGILMNGSFYLCEELIFLVSIITNIIREIGESLFNYNICFSELINILNTLTYFNDASINILSLDGIIKSFCSIGLLNLMLSYSLRYIMINVFILLSPFAILSLCLPSSSHFFKSWLRSFLSLLLIQTFVAILLVIFFSLNISSNDILTKLSIIGCIYALTRSNLYMREILGGITTDISNNFNFKQK